MLHFEQFQEFTTRFRLVESSGEITCNRYGMLLLHTTHLHTHMLCLHNHHHAKRIESLLYALLDLASHTLLYLQTMRENIHHPRNLAQPRDVSVGNVSHMNLAVKRKNVMFTQ